MPTFHDRKKVMGAIREYGARLNKEPAIDAYKRTGTAMMADIINRLGGLPVRNFSNGRLVEASEGTLKLGGDFIRELNSSRGGHISHACMPGCQIECSNVYVDESGKEVVSPLEYETIGLMGSNCGLEHSDQVARVNAVANDLGIDTIEAGATIGVLMEAGVGKFGDEAFILKVLDDMRQGNERGRIYAQGAARVGVHYKVARVPVIKQQAISAYDPRVIEVTGISMMVTAQGADHTTGNLPVFDCKDKNTDQLAEASLGIQTACATADSLGLCIFGRSVTNVSAELIVTALNDAHGTNLDITFMKTLGLETLRNEWAFNKQAGFTDKDDELPDFFYNEPLAPSNKAARHHGAEVNKRIRELMA
jgi:aldehyde:ferredoxin oxidoreductase